MIFADISFSVNFFKLFDIPIDLFPDQSVIQSTYYILSKKYHPDINQAADPELYFEILEMSGKVNTAYKTLTDFDQRLNYILNEFGVLEGQKEDLPPSFLMEIMDLNEAIMDIDENEEKRANLIKQITQLEEDNLENLKEIWQNINPDDPDMKQLNRLKSCYYQRKYLLRIRENLNSFAAR